jgi:hypothetical protein
MDRTFIVCQTPIDLGNMVGRLYEKVPSGGSKNFLTGLNYHYRPCKDSETIFLKHVHLMTKEELVMRIDMFCPDCRKLVSRETMTTTFPSRLFTSVNMGFTIDALDAMTYFEEIG